MQSDEWPQAGDGAVDPMTVTEWLELLVERGSIEVYGHRPSVATLVEKGYVALSAFHGRDKMWRTATLTDAGRTSLERRRARKKPIKAR